jgi:hypothetical protein
MEMGIRQIVILVQEGTVGPPHLFILIQQFPHCRLTPNKKNEQTNL